jgi:hypothetical protein
VSETPEADDAAQPADEDLWRQPDPPSIDVDDPGLATLTRVRVAMIGCNDMTCAACVTATPPPDLIRDARHSFRLVA